MAKQKLNLQSYQQDILARIKAVSNSSDIAVVSRLGVSIAGRNYLISLADICEVVPVPEVTKIPLTQPWFLGVANVRGNLSAITDLAAFLGHVPTQISSESRILLAHTRFDINAGLLVDRLIGLRNVNDMQVKRTVLEKGKPWQINGYQDGNGQEWQEIDIGTLMNQKEFMLVAI